MKQILEKSYSLCNRIHKPTLKVELNVYLLISYLQGNAQFRKFSQIGYFQIQKNYLTDIGFSYFLP